MATAMSPGPITARTAGPLGINPVLSSSVPAPDMRGDILTLMQDTDNQNAGFCDEVDDKMSFVAMDTHRRLKIAPFRRQFWHLGQQLEFPVQPVKISPPLFPAPCVLRISGDPSKIVCRRVADKKAGH